MITSLLLSGGVSKAHRKQRGRVCPFHTVTLSQGTKPNKSNYADNGIGIDEKYHDRIFQLFQRLNDIKCEGTGAGLAIAKEIVKDMGGHIWVDSAIGKGTTMYFTIPKSVGNSGEEARVEIDRHTLG